MFSPEKCQEMMDYIEDEKHVNKWISTIWGTHGHYKELLVYCTIDAIE